jgi:hypothetical protein
MKYLSKAYTYFIIYGEKFSPKELTNQTNIIPTNFGIKGEKTNTGVILKETFWKYQLEKTDALEGIENSLMILSETIYNKVNIIKDFISKYKLKSKFFIIIEFQNKENNGVILTLDFINLLNMLNSSIAIDVYPQV